mgnify:CR=1 FL=1
MSMKPQEISPVPEETARVARAANPKGNTYMNMRDELGSIYEDQISLLSEFRTRLLAGAAETQRLHALLELGKRRGWRNRTRTPAHRFERRVLAAIRESRST